MAGKTTYRAGSIAAQLTQPAIYCEAIARASEAYEFTRPDDSVLLSRDTMAIAKQLARTLADGTYVHGPATRRLVMLDKLRSLVQLTTLDRVMHSAVALLLGRAFEPKYSDDLYSYRPRRGRVDIADRIRELVTQHRERHANVLQRGLWVLRFDVKSYTDTIPIGDDSELWPMLTRWLPDEPPWVIELIRTLTRCAATDEFATCGTPTGSPMCNIFFNLYLADFDEEIRDRCALYVRFGDDATIIGDSADAVDAAYRTLTAAIARKRLRLNEAKLARIYWNGAARPSPHPDWIGSRYVTFVGFDLNFDGTHRIKTASRRELVHSINARLRTAARGLPSSLSVKERAHSLARTGAALLEPTSPFTLPALGSFLTSINCRTQLAEIDRQLAIEIARLASGVSGPKAFRAVPWRSLYAAGLPSLTALKNRQASSS